jgi:hypothetical protein
MPLSVACDTLNHVIFSLLFHLITQTSKNHNLSNFNPKIMGLFALYSLWPLFFYHIFSRILWSLVFVWHIGLWHVCIFCTFCQNNCEMMRMYPMAPKFFVLKLDTLMVILV